MKFSIWIKELHYNIIIISYVKINSNPWHESNFDWEKSLLKSWFDLTSCCLFNRQLTRRKKTAYALLQEQQYMYVLIFVIRGLSSPLVTLYRGTVSMRIKWDLIKNLSGEKVKLKSGNCNKLSINTISIEANKLFTCWIITKHI